MGLVDAEFIIFTLCSFYADDEYLNLPNITNFFILFFLNFGIKLSIDFKSNSKCRDMKTETSAFEVDIYDKNPIGKLSNGIRGEV